MKKTSKKTEYVEVIGNKEGWRYEIAQIEEDCAECGHTLPSAVGTFPEWFKPGYAMSFDFERKMIVFEREQLPAEIEADLCEVPICPYRTEKHVHLHPSVNDDSEIDVNADPDVQIGWRILALFETPEEASKAVHEMLKSSR